MRLKASTSASCAMSSGIGLVAERRQRCPVDGAAMPLDELAEGGRLAVANQLDQLAVGHPVANRRPPPEAC